MRQFRIFLSVLPALLLSLASTTAYAHRMPTITYADGKLTFADEVEGVTFNYGIYQGYEQTTSSTEPIAFPFNHVYIVQALAKKEGWRNSGIAEITVDLSDLKGDANGDGIISIADITIILENILNQ